MTSEPIPAAPSATQTPERPIIGSRNDRTSETVSEALKARALKAWETAYLSGASTTEAMSAALDAVLPRVVEMLAPEVDPDEFDRYRIVSLTGDALFVNCPRDECQGVDLAPAEDDVLTLGELMDIATEHEAEAHGGYQPIRCQVVDGPNGPLRVQADGPLPDGFGEAITALAEQARNRSSEPISASPGDGPSPAPLLDPDGPLTQLLDHDLAMVFVPKNAQVAQVTQAGNLSDLRQPFAEALAEAFTRPMPKLVKGRPTDEIADPHPGDRVDRTMSVQFTAGDGYPSFRMVTCMEAAEVCAAVRDKEMAALRQEVEQLRVAVNPTKTEAVTRLLASATSLVRIERNDARQRADRAEAHALRLRQAVTILRAALRHDTPCNGPSPDVDPCGACVAIEYLAGAAIDEPEIEGEPQETRNPGERPSERLPGPLHSPTGPRKDSLPEAALDEPEAHHE
jgi:hypothetical protein